MTNLIKQAATLSQLRQAVRANRGATFSYSAGTGKRIDDAIGALKDRMNHLVRSSGGSPTGPVLSEYKEMRKMHLKLRKLRTPRVQRFDRANIPEIHDGSWRAWAADKGKGMAPDTRSVLQQGAYTFGGALEEGVRVSKGKKRVIPATDIDEIIRLSGPDSKISRIGAPASSEGREFSTLNMTLHELDEFKNMGRKGRVSDMEIAGNHHVGIDPAILDMNRANMATGAGSAEFRAAIKKQRWDELDFLEKNLPPESSALITRLKTGKRINRHARKRLNRDWNAFVSSRGATHDHTTPFTERLMKSASREVRVGRKVYRPKVQAFMYDNQGRILAAKSQGSGSGLRAFNNYKFPGGGVEKGESITEAARKELLEEAGYETSGDLFEFGTPTAVNWDKSFRAQARKKGRGRYAGQYEYYAAGPIGKRNKSLLGSEGDELGSMEFVPLSQLQRDLTRTANDPNNEYGYFDKQKLVALRELKKEMINRGIKTASVAVKRDPAKWEAAKQQAKAKMGGKHSARAMQLATQIYKKNGGTYAGNKPSPSSNKLRKWTKQDWKWSGGDTEGDGGKGVYLPARASAALRSTKGGRAKLRRAAAEKRRATRAGQQFSSHGLHVGKDRGKVGND